MNSSPYLIELGHYAAYLAMVVAVIQALAPVAARLMHAPRLSNISLNAAVAVFALTSIGGLTIIHAFLTNDFSVAYVAAHSNVQLPLFYKIAALWGGHEGSLYLWVWILTFYCLLVAWHGRRHYADHLPVILAVEGALVAGFFGLILFLSSPFARMIPAPVNGQDLNPLLQDPGMVAHPPMLYMGYVGFSVPFAFAMTALITRWRSELWVGHIRRWALVAWGFLTTGILLGGAWAYYVLGWGGYWAWDPVENASLMPWLLGTALVHSITVQDRRRMLHTWNIFLVISTFSLSLLGTFLVRSGVLSSVHSFAVSPGRGAYILAFMTVVLGVSFGIFLARGRFQAAEESVTSMWSRESLFVWNNVLFCVACATVLLGTLYPLALEALTKTKLTVGAPYFNAVMVPILMVVILLMAIGPLVPWRKANLQRLRQHLLVPALAGIVAAVVVAVFFDGGSWVAPVAVGLATFTAAALLADYLRAIRQRRAQLSEPWPRAARKTVLGNRRHYGGMVVHFGIVIATLGLVGSGLFRSQTTVSVAPGDVFTVAGYQLRFEGVKPVQGPNYHAVQGRFTLLNNGRTVTPQRRTYPNQRMPMTETGIDSTPLRDVYVVLGGRAENDRWAVRTFINPLVEFIWIGGAIMLSGLALSLSGRRRRAAAKSEVPAAAATAK